MAILLKGKPVADKINEGLILKTQSLNNTPTLMIIRVGEKSDDLVYEHNIIKRCSILGIDVKRNVLPIDCDQSQLNYIIARSNSDTSIHGILLFRPLPEHLNEKEVCAAISPLKDIDGITRKSLYGIFSNTVKEFSIPCTAEACMELLSYYGYNLDGANVVVIGRSLVIGKPVSMLLQSKNATVTMCHSHTRNLDEICAKADIIIAAAGQKNLIGVNAVNENQVIIDVGINWDEEKCKIVGDVNFNEVEPIVAAITPVPGGVGAITTSILAKHVVAAAKHLSLDD